MFNDKPILIRIIFVGISFIAVGILFFISIERYKEMNTIDHRKAVELSDYGIQLIMEKIGNNLETKPFRIEGMEKTAYKGGWYRVETTVQRSDTAILVSIVAYGGFSTQEFTQKRDLILHPRVENNDTLWLPSGQRQ